MSDSTADETLAMVEFVLARIAENEAWARREDHACGGLGGNPSPVSGNRLLADCAAKRRLVEHLDMALRTAPPPTAHHIRGALYALAAAHHDHDDFRPAWRP